MILENLEKDSAICKCSQCSSSYEVKYKSDARRSPIGDLCNDCKYFIRDMELTKNNLRKAFNYDINTGLFTYAFTSRSGVKGEIAGKPHSGGYTKVRVQNKEMLLHRVIFMYMNGYMPKMVDHINHIRTDNRWCNLRGVDDLENCKNTSITKTSTTKVNGVAYHKPTGKYRVYIGINYKQKHLGLFDTLEEAKAAREKANIEYAFHPNHGDKV